MVWAGVHTMTGDERGTEIQMSTGLTRPPPGPGGEWRA